MKIRNYQDFVKKANEIHNNKYTYEHFIWVDSKTKGLITCPEHGDFPMSQNNHISGKKGCPECAKVAKITKEKVIKRIEESYGNEYEYEIPEKLNISNLDTSSVTTMEAMFEGCFMLKKLNLQN